MTDFLLTAPRSAVTYPHGFISAEQLAQLASTPADRLSLVLVRMGGCRFLAPAQDAKRIIDALEAAGDYCRDVSWPAR